MNSKFTLVTALAFVAFALTGCEEPAPTVVVAPEPAAQAEQLSKVRAAVDQAKTDNAANPDGHAKQAVDLQLTVAQSGLPVAQPEHKAAPAELSALVFAGKLDEALTRAATAETNLAALKRDADKQREQAAEEMRRVIADFNARLAAAAATAEREAYLRVVSVFAIIGGAITLIGIACAVTGWSRIGVLCIPAGIAIGGSGLLWGKPWFLWTIGGGVILCAVAAGIWWAVRHYESRNASKP
jgi:hypothetical protein